MLRLGAQWRSEINVRRSDGKDTIFSNMGQVRRWRADIRIQYQH